jgi:hypothetical protein
MPLGTKVNELSFKIPDHFNASSNSTRKSQFWINDFDFFWKAYYGMFISFVGPNFICKQLLIHFIYWYGLKATSS